MTDILKKQLLYVDDEKDNIDILKLLMEDQAIEVVGILSGKKALEEVRKTFFSVILLDIRMPGMDGIEVLERLKEESPQSLVMILSAYSKEEKVKKAYKKAGVYDVLDKPIHNDHLLVKIKKAFEHAGHLLESEQARKEVLKKYPYEDIVGVSTKMREVFELVEKVAPSESCVSISGETGTGKELIARAIHSKSKRPGPFVPVNAGALPETLLETALFGHERGAFTDAKERKFGYFESCKGGTIFLDEIGDISKNMQVRLLRVLQEKKITRVGSTTPVDVHARIITATNKSLEKLVKEGVFRQDLYYRINTVTIHLPLLRERPEDIPHLAEHFIKKHSKKDVKISDEAMDILMNYPFEGNIRELENIIERALIFQEDNVIRPKDFPPHLTGRGGFASELSEIFEVPWREAKATFEQMYIANVLEKAGGNVSEASRVSGFDRSYLQKQIKKYGIKK